MKTILSPTDSLFPQKVWRYEMLLLTLLPKLNNLTINKKVLTMDKKDKDIALFVAFCIEEYGAAKGMAGEHVLDLFSQYGVTDYLCNCFEPLHTQGRQWLLAEIDEFISIKKNKE